jgi:hypothetical protein
VCAGTAVSDATPPIPHPGGPCAVPATSSGQEQDRYRYLAYQSINANTFVLIFDSRA